MSNMGQDWKLEANGQNPGPDHLLQALGGSGTVGAVVESALKNVVVAGTEEKPLQTRTRLLVL